MIIYIYDTILSVFSVVSSSMNFKPRGEAVSSSSMSARNECVMLWWNLRVF